MRRGGVVCAGVGRPGGRACCLCLAVDPPAQPLQIHAHPAGGLSQELDGRVHQQPITGLQANGLKCSNYLLLRNWLQTSISLSLLHLELIFFKHQP